MLRYVVIARHGLCDSSFTNRLLTKEGEAQIKRLTEMLNPFLAGLSSLRIYTSIAQWTIQSAEILGAQFGIKPINFPALFMADINNDLRNTAELITRHIGVDAVILMTHERGTSCLAMHYAKAFFEKKLIFPPLWPGEAYVFDLQRKKAFKIFYPSEGEEIRKEEINIY